MLKLTGVVQNLYQQPGGVGRDGKPYEAQHKVQLLSDEQLPNGETRLGVVTLSTVHRDWFQRHQGHEVELPVGVMARGSQLTYFISKAWQPPEKLPDKPPQIDSKPFISSSKGSA